MEQRWTERIPMAVDVMVIYPSLGLVRGKSKDIGLDGMFVETGLLRWLQIPRYRLLLSCLRTKVTSSMSFAPKSCTHAVVGQAWCFGV